MTYEREIRRLRKQIPDDFPCEPGCFDCCKNHAWSWSEWLAVPPNLRMGRALHPEMPCPFSSPGGCLVYDYRPLICRLYGNADKIENLYGLPEISFACPRGIKPVSPLSQKQARDIFIGIIKIIHSEANDMLNNGAEPLFAGPYAAFVPRHESEAPASAGGV